MSNKAEDKMMKQAEKNALEPKLRFPEFRAAGEWKFIPLNKLAKRCTQKNRDGEIKGVLTNSAEYGVVDQRDYFDKDIATQGNLEGYFIVEKGDYVYNPRTSAMAPVGPISKNNIATGVMSPLYTVFRFANCHNDFYVFYFKTTGWHHYMRQVSSTGARHDRMAISNDNFEAMPLPVSAPEEQQKIADCLSSLDELVNLEVQKLDTLNTHKIGLMQQLFPAEDETLPQLRFPEFRGKGEWDAKKFGELCRFVRGPFGGALKKDIFVKDGYAVYEQSHAIYNDFSSFRYFITEEKYKELKRFSVRPADIIMSCSGTMGKFSVIPEGAKDGVINQALLKLTVNEGYHLGFVKLTLELPLNQEKLLSQSAGGAIKNVVGVSEMKEIELCLPSDDEEQQKIAACLTNLDDLITAQIRKLSILKTFKKGLMQQLFPVLDKVDV